MRYFPLFLDIKDKPVLLVGGGEVAARKFSLLVDAGANSGVAGRITFQDLTFTGISNFTLSATGFSLRNAFCMAREIS